MIDVRLLLDDFDATARRLSRKRVDPALISSARDLAVSRRSRVQAVDDARRDANAGATAIGRLMREGRTAEADEAKAAMAAARATVDALEAELRTAEAELDDVISRLPNLPADVAPDGKGEADNVVVRTEGYDPGDYEGRTWETHWDVAERLGIFDPTRAAKLSGTMFSLLRGDGARLLRGLVNFALDLHRDRYLEVAPAHVVREEVITRTGHLTKFESQAYRLRDDDLWLVPTAEVALMGMYQGEILPEADLPLRTMAYTVCWRREAGAAGKDTRGMQRLHEFHKVELVELCAPEDSEAELQALLADAEKAMHRPGPALPGGRAVLRRPDVLGVAGLRPGGVRPRGRPVAGGQLDEPGHRLPGPAGRDPAAAHGGQQGRAGPLPQRLGPGHAPGVGGHRRARAAARRHRCRPRRSGPLPGHRHAPAGAAMRFGQCRPPVP